MTPAEQRRADYVAAIGPNTGYYLKHFEDLDAGGPKVGWHWPAFFVTTFWFAYRKMWLPALLNFFWPVISFVIGAILVAFLGVPAGVVIYLLLLLAPSILLPMFANAIYRHHVHRLIAGLRPDIAASSGERHNPACAYCRFSYSTALAGAADSSASSAMPGSASVAIV